MFYGRETSAQWFSAKTKCSRGNQCEMQKVSRSLLETPRDSWRLCRFCICFSEHNKFTQKVVADIFPVSIILMENFQVISGHFHKFIWVGNMSATTFGENLFRSLKLTQKEKSHQESLRVSKRLLETFLRLFEYPHLHLKSSQKYLHI